MTLPIHALAALEYALDLPAGLEPVAASIRALLDEHAARLGDVPQLAAELRTEEHRGQWMQAGLWFATHAGDELLVIDADPRRLGRIDTLHFEEQMRRDAVIAAIGRGDALMAATLVGPECGTRSFWCEVQAVPGAPTTQAPRNAAAAQWPILERLVDALQTRAREPVIEAQAMAASRNRASQEWLAPMRLLVRKVASQIGVSLRGRTPRAAVEPPAGPVATLSARPPLLGLHRVRLRLTPPMPGHTIHVAAKPLSGVIALILDDSSLRWTATAPTTPDGIQDITLAAWSDSSAQHPVELVVCRNGAEVLRAPVVELRTRPLHDLVAPADVFAAPSAMAQFGATAAPAAARPPLPAEPPPPADPALAQLATVEPPALRAMVERLLRLGAITEPEVFEAGGYRLMAALDNGLAELSKRLGFKYEIRADELGRVVRRVG